MTPIALIGPFWGAILPYGQYHTPFRCRLGGAFANPRFFRYREKALLSRLVPYLTSQTAICGGYIPVAHAIGRSCNRG